MLARSLHLSNRLWFFLNSVGGSDMRNQSELFVADSVLQGNVEKDYGKEKPFYIWVPLDILA